MDIKRIIKGFFVRLPIMIVITIGFAYIAGLLVKSSDILIAKVGVLSKVGTFFSIFSPAFMVRRYCPPGVLCGGPGYFVSSEFNPFFLITSFILAHEIVVLYRKIRTLNQQRGESIKKV